MSGFSKPSRPRLCFAVGTHDEPGAAARKQVVVDLPNRDHDTPQRLQRAERGDDSSALARARAAHARPTVMDNVVAIEVSSSSSRRRGISLSDRDEDLSRLGAAFASLDAALLTGNVSKAHQNQWWAQIRGAMSIPATAARGRRIKATMLLAVIRETRADGPAWELARSIAFDLTARSGKKKVSPSPTDIAIRYFIDRGLSRRAARALTALGCKTVDDVLRLEERDFSSHRNCGRVTSRELHAFMLECRRTHIGLPR